MHTGFGLGITHFMPKHSGGGGGGSYPLDGGNAGFPYDSITTSGPAYTQGTYTYTGAATNGNAFALPKYANLVSTQAIVVGAGKILACEAEIVTGPTGGSFDETGMQSFAVNAGATTGASWYAAIKNTGGATPQYGATGATNQARAGATNGYRVALEFNGNTGVVTARFTDGTLASSTAFTPGQSIGFGTYAHDVGTTPAGQSVTLLLVPNAADMLLKYSVGAVDVFGALCPN